MNQLNNKSKIAVTSDLEVDLPVNKSAFAIDRRDWNRIKRAVQKMDFKSNKWEIAAWNTSASLFTVIVAAVTLQFTIDNNVVKVGFWVTTLILFFVTILLFIFSRQMNKIKESQKNDVLEAMEEVEALVAVVEGVSDTKLKILKATYGSSDQNIDVTKELVNEIKDNKLLIRADNNIKGDPHKGVVKNLNIRYLYQGQQLERNYKEGENVEIP